jgi:hypothetical protein
MQLPGIDFASQPRRGRVQQLPRDLFRRRFEA